MIDEDDIPTGEIEVDPEDLDEEGRKKVRRFGPELIMSVRELGQALNRRNDITVHRYEVPLSASIFTIETLEHGLGLRIPTSIRSFYEQLDGFELRWSYLEDGEQKPGGEIHLFSFGEVFGSWLDDLWGVTESEDTGDIDFTWELRAIDATPEAESNFMTVLHVPEVLPSFRLFLHDPYGETYPLEVDFFEYVHAMLDARGVFGWQYLLTPINFDDHPEALEQARNFYHVMNKIFPDADLSRFRDLPPDEN